MHVESSDDTVVIDDIEMVLFFVQILQNHGVDLLVFQVLFWLKISQPFFLFYEQQTKKIEISFLMIFSYFFVPFVHPIAYL